MADVLAVRNEYRTEKWSALIRECNASGLSNREFCRQHGISEKSFYYWLRKLRNQAAAQKKIHILQPKWQNSRQPSSNSRPRLMR